jgi:parallel beta-helix repeat protein
VILPIAINQSDAINQTLLSTYSKAPSTGLKKCSIYDPESNLITVFCNTKLSAIDHDINNKTVLKKENNGIWTLNAIIKVNPNARITIDKNDTSWLRITNQNVSEPNFIKISGSAKINGVKITSWNPLSNDVIKQNVNGTLARPYIVVDNATGPVDISNSEIAFLGHDKYPFNGFMFRHGGNGSSIYNNNIHDMWDGFYSDSVQSITIKKNIFHDNLRHGLNPDASSHDLIILGNSAYNNSEIGMLCSDRCHNILFDNNTVFNNGNSGFMFSSDTYNSTAKKNSAFNEKVGISIISSSNNKIYDNSFKSNERGIFIKGNSSGSNIYNNTLIDDKIGIYFDNSTTANNLLKNNHIDNTSTNPVFLNG